MQTDLPLIDYWMKRYAEVYKQTGLDGLTIDIISEESGFYPETICVWYEKYYYQHDLIINHIQPNFSNKIKNGRFN